MQSQMTTEDVKSGLITGGMDIDEAERVISGMLQLDRERREAMAAPGTMKLPERLEAARWEHGIPDGAFRDWPLDDRCYIYQPQVAKEFIPGGRIIKTEASALRDRHEAGEGVLVAWGLKAKDSLVPYGIELGMIVSFVQLAPWRRWFDDKASGKQDCIIVVRAGHLVGCVTTEEMRRAGELEELIMPYSTERGTTLLTHTLGGLEKQQPVVMEDY